MSEVDINSLQQTTLEKTYLSTIIKNNPSKVLHCISDGENVEFIIKETKGPKAVQDTGPDGQPVQGSVYELA